MSGITLRTEAQGLNVEAVKVIEKSLKYPSYEIYYFAWKAWCNPSSFTHGLGLELSEEDSKLWTNELIYQVEKKYPKDCFESEAYSRLVKASNSVVALVIHTAIVRYYNRFKHDLESIRRVGYLLRSDDKKSRFDGFRELRFYSFEAEALTPLHSQVSDLFEEIMTGMFPEYTQKESMKPAKPSTEKGSSKTSVVSIKTEAVKSPDEKGFSDYVAVHAEAKPEVIEVTADAVIANKQIIKEYYEIVEKLNGVGISPTLLIEKQTAFENLLAAVKAFE